MVVAVTTTTGGPPRAAHGAATEQVPAGLARQVDVQEDERRACAVRQGLAVASSADAASTTIQPRARRWRATIARSPSSSSTMRRWRSAIRRPLLRLDRLEDQGEALLAEPPARRHPDPTLGARSAGMVEEGVTEGEAAELHPGRVPLPPPSRWRSRRGRLPAPVHGCGACRIAIDVVHGPIVRPAPKRRRPNGGPRRSTSAQIGRPGALRVVRRVASPRRGRGTRPRARR